jgi:Trypsin-co-occurring domain 1
MAEVQWFQFQEGDETFDIYIEAATAATTDTYPRKKGIEDSPAVKSAAVKMDQAQKMIRGYTLYALSAFRNFAAAEVEEVSLKFGLKFNAKAGIPFIAESSSDCNLEISVKCKFPTKKE